LYSQCQAAVSDEKWGDACDVEAATQIVRSKMFVEAVACNVI
jgi:hypothetical protein